MIANLTKTFVGRLLAMAVSSVASFLTARLLLSEPSHDAYSLYVLLVGMPALLTFADLGTGAAIVNVIASTEDPAASETVERTLLTALRLTTASGMVIGAASVVFYITGAWPFLLGQTVAVPDGQLSTTIALCLFGLTIPLGVSFRVLLGVSKYHIAVLVQAIQGPITLALAYLVQQSGLVPTVFVSVGYFVALAVVGALALWLADRQVGGLVRRSLRRQLRIRVRGSREVVALGVPMLVQLAVLPVGVYSGRIILSHQAEQSWLATYGLASSVFAAIMSIVTAIGTGLWPYFVKARMTGRSGRPFRISLVFFSAAAVVCSLLIVGCGPVFDTLSGGTLPMPTDVVVAFSLQVVAQAALYPLGMYLTDHAGLRFQVIPTIAMTVMSLFLCFALLPAVHGGAPALASAMSILVCQVLTYSLEVRRRTRPEPEAAHEEAKV